MMLHTALLITLLTQNALTEATTQVNPGIVSRCKGKTPVPIKTPAPSWTTPTSPTSNPTSPSPTSAPGNSSEQWRTDMLAALNKERANGNGLKPFCLSAKLDDVAQGHAQDMATNNYFSHESRDGTTLWDRIKKVYPDANGENIAAGFPEIEKIVKMWMDSPGHRVGIMGDGPLGDSTQVGIGRGTNPNSQYKYYWVLDFGKSTTEPCV